MEKTSHYYALLALGLMHGLKSDIALKIAYASQFVDDAKINKFLFKERHEEEPFIPAGVGSVLHNVATCHSYMKIDTFNYQSMINNTALFHFFPGCDGVTFTEKMGCRQDPQILNDLITEALKEPFHPIRLGLLLHVYADSFAHQGFSGLLSVENDIKKLKTNEFHSGFKTALRKLRNWIVDKLDRAGDRFIPAYGHGQALDNPDVSYQ